jgi:hypothetical protein
MSKDKSKKGFYCLKLLTALVFAAIIGKNSYAETTYDKGLVTDSNNIRWEYNIETDTNTETGEQKKTLYFSFYDKPEDMSTVTVPTLSEMLSIVPNVPSDLDTYILSDAATVDQDNDYGATAPRRQATVETTKLDMSNTSKIQIKGVQPIINPDVETELVFGPNMVIQDATGTRIRALVCGKVTKNSWNNNYSCNDSESKYFDIPGFRKMTSTEISEYEATASSIGCFDYRTVTDATYDPNRCYVSTVNKVANYLGAFASYKLKLTNFEASNFNYIGWEAFANTEIAGGEVTISGDSFIGGDIFKGSNVTTVNINTDTIGEGIFRECQHLETINYGNNVTRVSNDAFSYTNLTSFDFSNTNIKTIGPRAFLGAKLTEVNLTGIQRIEYEAFMNNDLRELYLPKSINYLQALLFKGNLNLEKITVAYDTLTSGTTLQFYVVLDNEWSAGDYTSSKVKELTVLAPYAEDEEVSDTHIPYDQYKWHYHSVTQEYMEFECHPNRSYNGCSSAATNDYGMVQYAAYNTYGGARGIGSDFEDDYADVDSKKNIIAPAYFANLHGLKVITIGDGYEFIGSSAFTDWSDAGQGEGSNIILFEAEDTGNRLYLPDSLKGIGNLAFDHLFNREYTEFTIPRGIEFIGIFAFKNVYYYDGDVDFPNLVALGDHAFEKTRTRNVHLYDKLVYMGAQVFSDCVFLNDLTFDLDVFDPDIYIAWALPHRHWPEWYDGQFHITTEFGPRSSWYPSDSDVQKYGLNVNHDQANNYWPLKFGTITFTDKNVSPLPNGYHNCYYFSEYTTDAITGCPGGYYGTGIYNTFFGHVNAEKIDLGGTDWKILSPRMFVQTAVGEVVLPHGLEVIPGDSFSDSFIQKELILPDTIRVIGDAAFDFGMTQYQGHQWNSQTQQYEDNVEWLQNHTIHITKLPESLEYLGNDAFYNDWGLQADLNSPNLRHIGYKAFWGTRLRDVYLPPTVKALQAAAFANISTLRDITIDFDLGALPPNYDEGLNPNDFPQSLVDFAGANLYQVIHMSCSAKGMANSRDYPVTTFYSLFNQGIACDIKNDNGQIIAYGQKLASTHYRNVTFTDKNQTDIYMTGPGYFGGLQFDKLDMGKAGWKHTVKNVPWGFEGTKIGTLILPEGLETFTMGAFENAEITEPFTWPSTLKTFNTSAFQWAKGTATNELPEGIETFGSAVFYEADMTDNLVIPSTVTSIGWSAFNAGSADVHYDTVTIRPDLTSAMDSGQLVHTLLWHVDLDKLIVESNVLPVLEKYENGEEISEWQQEFWHLPMDEVVLTNLRGITRKAFDGCTNLTKVDASENANIRHIDEEAFKGDEKLHIFTFSPNIANETVTIGKYAFEGTAFETMTDGNSDFNLTAAKFDASEGFAFYGMPKLRVVSIPSTFSNATVPEATFANNPELEEVTVDYRITNIRDDAFAEDHKLARIFIWGNTVVTDSDLPGYEEPEYYGRGGDGDTDADDEEDNGPVLGLTIPETTDIYAYSVSPTEAYAGDVRDDLEGDFYPLDEVLYVTTNNPRVKISDDNTDFDKSRVVVYGMRRDGVILQSDEWGEFDGTVFPRSESALVFERMEGVMEENPEFGAVYDTPVPLTALNYDNANFEEIDFELIPDENDGTIRLINVIYTDGYTRGTPDTDIDPYTEGNNNPIVPDPIEDIIEDLIDGPITLDKAIATYAIMSILLIGAIILIIKKKTIKR